jgi:hypothetical protein
MENIPNGFPEERWKLLTMSQKAYWWARIEKHGDYQTAFEAISQTSRGNKGNRTLTDEQVEAIRESEDTNKELALLYNVSIATISRIRNNRSR